MFALDVLNDKDSFLKIGLQLLIHLIPSMMLIVILLIAWRWQLIGGIAYILVSALYFIFTMGKEQLSTYVIISGSAAIIGLMFIGDWIINKKVEKKRTW